MVELVTGTKNIQQIASRQDQSLIHKKPTGNSRMAGSTPVWQAAEVATKSTDISFTQALSQPKESRHSNPPSLSFGEVLDIINPLQHLPIVSSIYREVTGDSISPVARIAGGAIYGGPVGAAAALANAAIEEHSGKDLAGNVMAAFNGKANTNTDIPEIKLGRAMEESRMAGSQPHRNTKSDGGRTAGSNHALGFAPSDQPVEAPVIPASKGRSAGEEVITQEKGFDNLLDTMPAREPVTKVHISDNSRFKQVWNFNA